MATGGRRRSVESASRSIRLFPGVTIPVAWCMVSQSRRVSYRHATSVANRRMLVGPPTLPSAQRGTSPSLGRVQNQSGRIVPRPMRRGKVRHLHRPHTFPISPFGWRTDRRPTTGGGGRLGPKAIPSAVITSRFFTTWAVAVLLVKHKTTPNDPSRPFLPSLQIFSVDPPAVPCPAAHPTCSRNLRPSFTRESLDRRRSLALASDRSRDIIITSVSRLEPCSPRSSAAARS